MCVRHPRVAPQVATLKADLRSFMADVRGTINLADLGTRFPKARLKSAGYPSLKAFVAAFPSLVMVEQRNNGEIWLRKNPAMDAEVCRPTGASQALPQVCRVCPLCPSALRWTASGGGHVTRDAVLHRDSGAGYGRPGGRRFVPERYRQAPASPMAGPHTVRPQPNGRQCQYCMTAGSTPWAIKCSQQGAIGCKSLET